MEEEAATVCGHSLRQATFCNVAARVDFRADKLTHEGAKLFNHRVNAVGNLDNSRSLLASSGSGNALCGLLFLGAFGGFMSDGTGEGAFEHNLIGLGALNLGADGRHSGNGVCVTGDDGKREAFRLKLKLDNASVNGGNLAANVVGGCNLFGHGRAFMSREKEPHTSSGPIDQR